MGQNDEGAGTRHLVSDGAAIDRNEFRHQILLSAHSSLSRVMGRSRTRTPVAW
jgi:hypothetical protein